MIAWLASAKARCTKAACECRLPYTPLAGLTPEGKETPVIAVAIVLIGTGLFAFLAVLLRLA
jgi:hypothetical protein